MSEGMRGRFSWRLGFKPRTSNTSPRRGIQDGIGGGAGGGGGGVGAGNYNQSSKVAGPTIHWGISPGKVPFLMVQ